METFKRMNQVKYIIATHEQTGSIKGTASREQVFKNTVREYVRRAKEYNEDLSQILDFKESGLILMIYRGVVDSVSAGREAVFGNNIDRGINEPPRVGVTYKLF